MAYDLGSYQPPPRAYLAQRAPQSPRTAHQQLVYAQEQDPQGYHSLSTAHDDHLYRDHERHEPPLVNDRTRPSAGRADSQDQQHPRQASRGRSDRDESRRREPSRPGARRPLVENKSPGAMSMPQDNAFPVFPTKRAAAHQQSKPRDDDNRPRPSTANANRPRNHSDRLHPPNASRTRPSTSDSAHPPPPREQRDPYRSPPRQPPAQLAPLPTFSPPYSTSSRPSTSDSANGRERPFLAPLNTQVVGDPRSVESPLLSTVTARHHPAIVPISHTPLEARISQSAHLSHGSAYHDEFAHPHQPWNANPAKHESLGGVYDDYYQEPPKPANREAEIEAEMPNFDKSTAHRRQPTIDRDLDNMHLDRQPPPPALQRQPTYQTASSKLKAAKSQPDMRQRTPVQEDMNAFDFGFAGQPLTHSPEPQYGHHVPSRPQQAHYYPEQPPPQPQQAQYYSEQPPPQPQQAQYYPEQPPPQRNRSYDDQFSAPARPPQPPQHSYSYDDRHNVHDVHLQNQERNAGYDVRPDASQRPQRDQLYEQGYANQGHAPLQPPQSQQRSQSYDDPRTGPARPPNQQRAFTYDDQGPYSRQQFNAQPPMQQGRPTPNGAMPRGPMPNGSMPGPVPGGPMPRGPPRRGPMPPGQGLPGAMPSGPVPNGQPRRGPMPHATMHGGPSPRGPQSRRPPPGQSDYRPAPGTQTMPMDGRVPTQRYPLSDRAPSAPVTQNGFAPPPPRHADHGYGPDPTMNGRGPKPRYAMNDRSPSAPAVQNGFAPPPPLDRSFGTPLAKQQSAPQTVPGVQQYGQNQTENPDALPRHPVPVRPGLNNPSAAQGPKPGPVRQYTSDASLSSSTHSQPQPQSQPQIQSQPSKVRSPSVDESSISGPVTRAELDTLRAKVDANPNDMKTALLLAKKLAEASTVLASENGRLDARMTAKNSERYALDAHKRVKKLVAANYPDAMFYLADCYGSGDLGLEVDAKQAFSLYQSAAKAGHGAAAYRTAMCCEMGAEEGGGTKRDHHKAVQWYQRAAQLNDVAAMYKMGMILLRGLLGQQRNVGQSLVYLKKAADQADANNPHAIHELARLHEEGNPDPAIRAAVKPDERYAQKMYMQAAKMGHKQSQFRLGQAFEYGSIGLPVDSRNSIAWYTKAAAQGEHNSELALSGWYLTGAEGILGQSDTEAYLWARKAALSEPPLAKAMYALGYYIENGIGCPSSLDEAKKWYTRAASYKFPKAVERLEEIRKGKVGRPQPNQGRLTRSNQKRDEAECIVM